MSDLAQRIDATAIADLRVSQWDDAPRLQALISELLGVVTDSLTDPLAYLERQLRPTTAEGVWLDHVGDRVGCIRPTIDDDAIERFGFDQAGVGFDQAPFSTVQDELVPQVAVGDAYYRCFVDFCARAALSDGSVGSLEEALRCDFANAIVVDNADGTAVIRNVANDPRPEIVGLITPMIMDAMPAGIAVTIHDPPGAPVLTATVVSSTQIDLSWTQPRDHGEAITGYDVERRFVNAQTWRDQGHTGTGRTLSITGLRANRTYLFRVRAVNSVGNGPWSTVVTARTLSS